MSYFWTAVINSYEPLCSIKNGEFLASQKGFSPVFLGTNAVNTLVLMPACLSSYVTSSWKVYGSNPSQGTDHPAMFCCSFIQSLQANGG
jgi:hypothetical protein